MLIVSFAEFAQSGSMKVLLGCLLERATCGLNGLAKAPRKFTSPEKSRPTRTGNKPRTYRSGS